MPRITPLFLLSILLSFFLFSGQNALTNDDDTNKRATLLALLKNTFIDNTENKKPDDINTALENINNMTLHPTDTDKFNKFLDHFLKFFHIYVSFSDKDKRVLHLSGVLNEVYVDVESLSEENLQKHFDSVHEKGLNLINLIVHSNLVHPKYDETAVQGMEGEEPEQTDGPTEGPGSHGKVDPPQEGDPAQESHPHQKDGPAQQDHSQEYAVTPEYADHYHYGGHEEDPEDMDYENGEEYDAQGDPDDHDEHYEFDEHDEHDEHGEHDEPYHEEDKKKIKYVGKKLKNLLAMKNIKLNNNSTGEFKVNFYTNYVNYINTPYGAPLLPFHKDSYEYAEVYSGDKLHPKKHGDEQMYYVGEKELIPVHGKGDMQKEGPYDVYKGAMKGIYENIKKKAAKKGGKNGWWGKKKAGKYQIKEDSNGDDDDDEDGDGDGDDDDDDDNGDDDDDDNGDDDDDEDPDEDDQLQNEPLHKGHGPNKKPKYGHKKKKIHGENVDDEETTDKAPSEKGKKGIDFAYTYYNPYYMFKLGSNMPTGKKAQPSGKGAPAKGGLLKGGKGHDEEEEEVADEEEEEEEEAEEVADAEDVADEEDAEEVADEDADVTDGDDAEKQHAKKSAANLFVNTLLELAGYLEPSESKKSELKEDKNSLGQANKSRPIYKKKEMKSRKMKTKKDIVDEKTTEKIKDTMYVKVGQNGTNGFLNFFDFREYAVKENFKDLLKVMETLKVFNITETIIFIQKFTESVCASYCMGITDVLELVNNDMLLYEKMSFHFRKNGMTVTTNSNYEFNGINFESLLALLNINKETIPLTCPCKSYTNNIISYCKQYKSNLKGYFTQSKNSEYLEKFTPYYLLEQLILLEDKLNYIKKNGKISSDTSVKILESKDLHTTAYYHNNRYFPPLKASSASSTAPVSAVGGKSGLNRVGGFGGNGVDGNGVSSHGSNHGGGELADELKYPDVDTLNIYYNASPVNLKSIHDVKNVLIDEVKSKIFYINSYRIGNQFFPTYSNLGKDDHDLEILESANSSKLKVEGRTSKRSPKLGHFVVPKLESVEKHSTGGSGGSDGSDGSDEDSDETTDAGSDGGSVGGGALAKHKIMGNSDWIPLKSPPNHEDFYNAKKRHTNLLDHEGKQLCEKKMDDSDCVSLKCAFLEKDARAKESGECDKEVVDKHTGDKEASDKQTGEGGETDGADQAESQNNVNESEEHSAESLKLQSKMGEPLSCKKKKAISAKYLIYFFKNVHVWKTGEYCQNVNYIDNWLKKINYNEEIIFQEQLDEDSVVLYFSSNLKDKYKLDMEYFIFLLQKISLIMYVEDLCGIFQIDEMKQNKKIDKHIENPANIHNFMEKHILFSHEQYSKKNKYAKELSIISTSNFFSSKKDIILNSQPYNNIVFNEKEIYESLYVYMEDVLTERMINETWLTPYGFILCKPTLSDANNYKLKISQNEFITKYSRSAIDKYMYYEYRKIGNNIVQHHLDLSPKLSEHLAELKEYRLIIYNDNPSMTNIIITTTVNVLNIAFLQSLLEVILDIRATQQFFSYKGRFIPINAFIILDEGVNYLFFNYVPNENHINYAA